VSNVRLLSALLQFKHYVTHDTVSKIRISSPRRECLRLKTKLKTETTELSPGQEGESPNTLQGASEASWVGWYWWSGYVSWWIWTSVGHCNIRWSALPFLLHHCSMDAWRSPVAQYIGHQQRVGRWWTWRFQPVRAKITTSEHFLKRLQKATEYAYPYPIDSKFRMFYDSSIS